MTLTLSFSFNSNLLKSLHLFTSREIEWKSQICTEEAGITVETEVNRKGKRKKERRKRATSRKRRSSKRYRGEAPPRPNKILFSPRLSQVYELTFLRHLRGRRARAGARRRRHCNERNKFLFLIKVSLRGARWCWQARWWPVQEQHG